MDKINKGFTIVELMIVVSVIGMIIAMIVPQLFRLKCEDYATKMNQNTEICDNSEGREKIELMYHNKEIKIQTNLCEDYIELLTNCNDELYKTKLVKPNLCPVYSCPEDIND